MASTIIGLLLAANTAGAQSAGDTFPRLPAAEVQGKQIGWTVNATLDAFVRAVETVKPLVIVFGDVNSGFTRKLTELVLACPHLNQLAGVAVFAYGAPATDEYARRMASRFKLQTYPTISVIASRTDTLTELYRMEGLFDAERIAGDLQQTLRQNGYWLRRLEASYLYSMDPTDILRRTERIDAVTPRVLQETFRRYFPFERYTIVTLVPETT